MLLPPHFLAANIFLSSHIPRMQLSHYALIFPWPNDPDLRLLFSTRTGASALVPLEIFAGMESGALDAESTATLTELGFVVPDRQAEKAAVLNLPAELNRLRMVMKVSIVVTMECNFRCRYCYEGSRKGKQRMSEVTAKRLVEYIKERFTPETTRLTLDFYGGEPLLAVAMIKKIAAPLKEYMEQRGAEFEITLVTNGSLLTRENVEALLPVGLSRAKVTIDGPPRVHNAFRPFKNGGPTFDRIVDNIRQCAELVRIAVSGNFTRDTYREFPELFTHLAQAALTPEKISRISFAPVLHVGGPHATDFCGGCVSSGEKWLARAAAYLDREIAGHGFPPATGAFSPSLCMVDVDNSFVVHYDGGIYQCVAMVGNSEFRCGDIFTGMTDYREQYHVGHWQKEETCRECVSLPLCFGGCRFMAWQRDGDMGRVECMQGFYDAVLADLVGQDSFGAHAVETSRYPREKIHFSGDIMQKTGCG